MTLTKVAIAKVAGAAALAGLVVALALPAEAATKKRKNSVIYYGHQDTHVVRGRAGTRIVVRRRSYLDPGTETKQYEEHYTDYAYPRDYSPAGVGPGDFKTSFSRMPLPGRYDIPNWGRY
jgi:hypothetical protein